jgi:hypothetical protein
MAIFCFLIFEGSPGSLAMRHLLDVSTLFAGLKLTGFRVEPCFMLYRPHYGAAFASSNLSHTLLQQHALR